MLRGKNAPRTVGGLKNSALGQALAKRVYDGINVAYTEVASVSITAAQLAAAAEASHRNGEGGRKLVFNGVPKFVKNAYDFSNLPPALHKQPLSRVSGMGLLRASKPGVHRTAYNPSLTVNGKIDISLPEACEHSLANNDKYNLGRIAAAHLSAMPGGRLPTDDEQLTFTIKNQKIECPGNVYGKENARSLEHKKIVRYFSILMHAFNEVHKDTGVLIPYAQEFHGLLFENPFGEHDLIPTLKQCVDFTMAKNQIIPGITHPLLYVGYGGSLFGLHEEDHSLFSINFMFCGEPKIWIFIRPESREDFNVILREYYPGEYAKCEAPIRHKDFWIDPEVLLSRGIKLEIIVQRPNELVITNPGAVHYGFNVGPNMNEAFNVALPSWLETHAFSSKVCTCDGQSCVMFNLAPLLANKNGPFSLNTYLPNADQLRDTFIEQYKANARYRNLKAVRLLKDYMASELTLLQVDDPSTTMAQVEVTNDVKLRIANQSGMVVGNVKKLASNIRTAAKENREYSGAVFNKAQQREKVPQCLRTYFKRHVGSTPDDDLRTTFVQKYAETKPEKASVARINGKRMFDNLLKDHNKRKT